MRVWLVPRRAAWIERGGHDLERVERLRREQRLAAEVPPFEQLPFLAAQDTRPDLRLPREQVRDLDPDRRRQPLQGRHARARATPLEPADEALAYTRRLSHVPQGQPTQHPDRTQPLAELWCSVR